MLPEILAAPNDSPRKKVVPVLIARNLKCTLVLDPAELAALPEPSTARVTLHIKVADGGRSVTADIAPQSR